MADSTPKLKALEAEMSSLFKEVIKTKGLVDTGHLLNSIKFTLVRTSSGYSFQMEALDYYKYIDEKYKITDTALNSGKFKRIQERIIDIVSDEILGELDKI